MGKHRKSMKQMFVVEYFDTDAQHRVDKSIWHHEWAFESGTEAQQFIRNEIAHFGDQYDHRIVIFDRSDKRYKRNRKK